MSSESFGDKEKNNEERGSTIFYVTKGNNENDNYNNRKSKRGRNKVGVVCGEKFGVLVLCCFLILQILVCCL